MDPIIKEEISEYPFDPMEVRVNEKEEERATPAKLKRGPAKLEDQWTRVISLHHDNLTKLRHVSVQNDIQIVRNIDITKPSIPGEPEWTPLFFSPNFCAQHEELKEEDFRLDVETLRRYGEQISQMRADIA